MYLNQSNLGSARRSQPFMSDSFLGSGADAMLSDWLSYWANSKPGQSNVWAGGLLTRTASGATYKAIDAVYEGATFDQNTPFEQLASGYPGIARLWWKQYGYFTPGYFGDTVIRTPAEMMAWRPTVGLANTAWGRFDYRGLPILDPQLVAIWRADTGAPEPVFAVPTPGDVPIYNTPAPGSSAPYMPPAPAPKPAPNPAPQNLNPLNPPPSPLTTYRDSFNDPPMHTMPIEADRGGVPITVSKPSVSPTTVALAVGALLMLRGVLK